MKTPFENMNTETLTILRDNLRNGLTVVAEHIDNGTFNETTPTGKAPPAQSGQLTLVLLLVIENELERRKT